MLLYFLIVLVVALAFIYFVERILSKIFGVSKPKFFNYEYVSNLHRVIEKVLGIIGGILTLLGPYLFSIKIFIFSLIGLIVLWSLIRGHFEYHYSDERKKSFVTLTVMTLTSILLILLHQNIEKLFGGF